MIKNLAKVLLPKVVFFAAVLPLLAVLTVQNAHAQSAEIRSAGVYYLETALTSLPDGVVKANQTGSKTDITTAKYCGWTGAQLTATEAKDRNINKSAITNQTPHSTNDPWDTSALIEYDQPYTTPNGGNKYPNHCLSLCFDVYCTNKPNGATTYSISFPLQTIQFEIARYNNSKDIGSSETNPPVRTIHK